MQIYHTTVKNYLLNVDRAQELICEHLHLINANLESEIKIIIRLVYLACAKGNILKKR